MADPIVITGDLAVFPTMMAAATIVGPTSTTIAGTGKAKIGGKPVCVAGDEAKVVLAVGYSLSGFDTPGTGTLTITAVDGQKSSKTKSGGNPVLIARGKFTAKLTVGTKAMQSASGTMDPNSEYAGQGEFQSTNTRGKLGG